jgi:hypothetical protein
MGRAKARAVSRRPLTAEARLHLGAIHVGLGGGLRGSGGDRMNAI